MKRIVIFGLALMAVGVSWAEETVIKIENCSIEEYYEGGRPEVCPKPIECVFWSVAEPCSLEAGENSRAQLLCEGEPYMTLETIVRLPGEYTRYSEILSPQQEPIVLPKGKNYTIILPKGAYHNVDNPQQVTEEHVYSFRVPDKIDFYEGHFQSRETTHVWFHSGRPLKVLKSGAAKLYRNGEFVENGTVSVRNGDWNLNYVYADFPTEYAEQGATYRVVIDAGAVSYEYREDIINDELEENFLGTYVEPEPDVAETWPSYGGCRWDAGFGDVVTVNSIEFYFGEEVALGRDAKVRFISYPSYTDYDAVPAQLRAEPDRWVVYGDFGGREYLLEDLNRVEGMQGITFCLSEGAIYNPKDGTPGEMITAGFSGLDNVAADVTEAVVTVAGRNVTVTAERAGMPVAVYGIDGSLKASGMTVAGAVTLEVPAAGIYIVRTGSSAVKVAVNG